MNLVMTNDWVTISSDLNSGQCIPINIVVLNETSTLEYKNSILDIRKIFLKHFL